MSDRVYRLAVWVVSGGCVAGGMIGRPADAIAGAIRNGGAPLTVRSYVDSIAADTFANARELATSTLARAGVELDWLDCNSSHMSAKQHAVCERPAAPTEIIVHIVAIGPRSDAGHEPLALGYSYVDVKARAGTLATIFADRVIAMAAMARTDAADLMGRAIAHEIGHLILGTNDHSTNGLMRAVWSTVDLHKGCALDWVFSGEEGTAMRRALITRASGASLQK